jgi:polyisoprenoid-binding protein YceI
VRSLGYSLLMLTCLVVCGCQQGANKGDNAKDGKKDDKSAAPTFTPITLATPPTGAYVFSDEGSKIEFTGTKMEGKHDGGFKHFLGAIEMPDINPTDAKFSVEIDIGSLYSDNPKLTGHLLGTDFFDAKTHPKATFVSSNVLALIGKDTTHTINGDLTLLGVKKSISLPAKINTSPGEVTLTSEFPISRGEFGMTYGKDKIDDAVTIRLNLRAVKKK